MKSIPVQGFPIGPSALICAVVVYVAAVPDVPQDDAPAATVAIGASR